jgi:hypothetical protein
MKKLILLFALSIQLQSLYAQETHETTAWSRSGTFTFLLNQSAFENWVFLEP